MTTQYHILNGDALKAQFPATLSGEQIVLRECLVDGPVEGDNLEKLLATRATFISEHYEGVTEAEYYEKILPEFQKIINIPLDSEVNLWFEEDLFCQVNFWFTIHLLQQYIPTTSIYLVKPNPPNQYAFGYLTKEELSSLFKERQLLSRIEELASLWIYYQEAKTNELLQTAESLANEYPFIAPAVKAHLDRMPKEGQLGRPDQLLLQIMKDLGTQEFGPVFRAFNKQAAIYGFGDVQVMRLWKKLIDSTIAIASHNIFFGASNCKDRFSKPILTITDSKKPSTELAKQAR